MTDIRDTLPSRTPVDAKPDEESMNNETIWGKILTAMGEEPHSIGRAGCIPVFDGTQWRVFRNPMTIYPGVENCADPAKVDTLRDNAVNLLEHYPETVPQLEKFGARVRALLNRQIETYEDVLAWAESPFNSGPSAKAPQHVHETMDLAYDDLVIEVKTGKDPVYVIPAAPRGEGLYATIDFTVPGSRVRYGPRSEFTKQAFTKQTPKKVVKRRYRGKTADGEPQRPRGRPRKDGLVPGSVEARRVDRKREKEREARRQARLARQAAAQPKPFKGLTRIGTKRAS